MLITSLKDNIIMSAVFYRKNSGINVNIAWPLSLEDSLTFNFKIKIYFN